MPAAEPETPPVATTVTLEGGRFELSSVPDTRLVIEAEAETGARVRAPVELKNGAASGVQLRFPRPGGIEGEVIDAHGRFVNRATVILVAPDGQQGPEVKMSGAAFEALGLNPGPWTLKVQAPGYVPAERHVLVLPGESTRVASVRDVSITLAPDE